MKSVFNRIVLLTAVLFLGWGANSHAFARLPGLVIHGVELGIGKFHRMDNFYHPQTVRNMWLNYTLPVGINPTPQSPIYRQKNADGSFSIFVTSIDELLTESVRLSKETNRPISVLNLNVHGLPGGMGIPRDAKQRQSIECSSWRASSYGSDAPNYNAYYRAISLSDILQVRALANSTASMGFMCISQLSDWKAAIQTTQIAQYMAPGAEVHLISCTVGLGKRGRIFTDGLAAAFFTGRTGRVMTSLNFGLGDASLPEGMGFWDYYTQKQLDDDNAIYVKNKRDRDIAKVGNILVSTVNVNQIVSQYFEVPKMFLHIELPVAASGLRLIDPAAPAFRQSNGHRPFDLDFQDDESSTSVTQDFTGFKIPRSNIVIQ